MPHDSNKQTPRMTMISYERHSKITTNQLAERLSIGLKRAEATLRVTTQRGTRSAILPISRQYRADRIFNHKRLSGKFSTDTLWSNNTSIRGNVCTQIYSHKCGFYVPYHMKRANNENVGQSLTRFISDYGIPEHLTYDGAAVQTGSRTLFQDTIRKYWIKPHVSAPRRPNENPVEGAICEIKK